MVVPARPVPGAPIESAWGDIAHDTVVAQDLQAGTVAVAFAASAISALITVTFPRAFAAVPVVTVTGMEAGNGSNLNVGLRAITTTTFQVQARDVRETAQTLTLTVGWVAIGPRT